MRERVLNAPPIQGTDGNFYGTTSIGAIGFGTVYKVTPAGVFTVLYAFDVTHGSTPIAPLIQANDGNFYGTTKVGGTFGFGTAFKITPAGTLTVLYNFDSTHGSNIFAPLVQGSDGNFYGTARNGGTKNGGGVVFKLTAAKKLTVIYNFDATGATKDGTQPYAGLVEAANGFFLGTTSAGGTNAAWTLYAVHKDGTGETIISNLAVATGSLPTATLIEHTFGKFYGEATTGGKAGHGALFRMDLGPGGAYIIVQPAAGLVSQPVGILGDLLSGTTSVKFNGKNAAFSIVSDTYITTSVPDGATTGLIKVVIPNGTLQTKHKFRVIQVVLSFSPSGARWGPR